MDNIERNTNLDKTMRENVGTYVVRVDLSDGSAVFPAKIEKSDIDWKRDLKEAQDYYRSKYQDAGTVTIQYALDIYDINMPNALTVKTWKFEKQHMFADKSMNQKERFLDSLIQRGISSWVIALLEKNMAADENEEIFLERMKLQYPQQDVQKSLENALDIAKEAHVHQSQKRPQDEEGLDSVPYVNHPIKVATHILTHGGSVAAVEAALLHDVIEDTEYNEEDLRQRGVCEETLALLRDVTKLPDESREEYMERVSHLRGESKAIKCFDRYDNLLRSFSIKDRNYIDRYIRETRQTFLPYLESQPDFSDLALQMEKLLEEMEKYRDSLQ